MASFTAQLMRTTLRLMRNVDSSLTDLAVSRARMESLMAGIPLAKGVKVIEKALGGCHAEQYIPDEAPENRVVLYGHGGGYVLGSCKTHRAFVSVIAKEANLKIWMPEYRLAPEHPFPAAVEDGLQAYRTLLAEGFLPENILLGGDSAGGGWTVAVLVALREAGLPLPKAAFLLSPWLDLTCTAPSIRQNAYADVFLSYDLHLRHAAKMYLQETDPKTPLASPLFADLSGLPPIFIQVGDDEILRDDALRLEHKITEAGGEVSLEVYPQMWHGWHFFHMLPERDHALQALTQWIKQVF